MSMEVPVVKGGIAEGLQSFGETLKNTAIWLGHTIQKGFIALKEAIQNAWAISMPHLKNGAFKTLEFLRTPAGFALLGGVIGTVLGVAAEAVNEKKSVAIALRVAAAAAYIGMGIAIGVGIFHGFLNGVV
jgi:hypothetical protein